LSDVQNDAKSPENIDFSGLLLKYCHFIISAIPAFQRPCLSIFAKHLYINGVLPILLA
jgi:hypothetical protein